MEFYFHAERGTWIALEGGFNPKICFELIWKAINAMLRLLRASTHSENTDTPLVSSVCRMHKRLTMPAPSMLKIAISKWTTKTSINRFQSKITNVVVQNEKEKKYTKKEKVIAWSFVEKQNYLEMGLHRYNLRTNWENTSLPTTAMYGTKARVAAVMRGDGVPLLRAVNIRESLFSIEKDWNEHLISKRIYFKQEQ